MVLQGLGHSFRPDWTPHDGGTILIDAWQRARTYYGVTDRRIIVVTVFFQESVESLYYRAIGQAYLTTCKDGSGTIAFGPIPSGPSSLDRSATGRTRRAQSAAFALRMIENARDVYEMILKLQAATAG
jgi:hypothetical protein